MRPLMILLAILIFAIGCGETDEPLKPTEQTPEQTDQAGDLPAPENLNTKVLQLVSRQFRFEKSWSREQSFVLPSEKTEMITPIDRFTEVYTLRQGQLVKEERIFKRETWQFLWCILDGEVVLVSILDNQIHPVSDEEDYEHFAANNDEWNKLYDEIAKERGDEIAKERGEDGIEVHGEINSLVQAKMSKKTFYFNETMDSPGDKIEVVIKHSFKYPYKHTFIHEITKNLAVIDKERTLLFVNVKRNITRPHITFPRPL